MACIETLECGHSAALDELLFLRDLLIHLVGGVEALPDGPGSLGFTDIYRSPALGADNFIRLEKPSEDLLEHIAALRALASESVLKLNYKN